MIIDYCSLYDRVESILDMAQSLACFNQTLQNYLSTNKAQTTPQQLDLLCPSHLSKMNENESEFSTLWLMQSLLGIHSPDALIPLCMVAVSK